MYKVTFRKVRSMREWVYNCWNGVMDHRINPLRAITDLKFTTAGDYMSMTTEGPFEEAFRADTAGVVRREIISYRVEKGMMIKHCASRDYYESGDYHDSVNTTPLPVR